MMMKSVVFGLMYLLAIGVMAFVSSPMNSNVPEVLENPSQTDSAMLTLTIVESSQTPDPPGR